MVTTSEIRERFLAYFVEHGHERVPSASLVPGTDKTLLFTNAGMVPFKDVFTGEEKRDYVRATSSQRCVRAGGKHNDLDNVGYTARHHTFFEMLGNFSFGDYFKREAIGFAWEFLTGRLGLPADRLWITVFEEDEEAMRLWVEEIGVPAERVIRIGAKDNFWAMGDTGPCGPCSEIFYDHGPEVAGGPPGSPEEDGDRYIEIWNLVFMQYDRAADGTLVPLPEPCVDTGMGLERIAAVLQHVHGNYEIDLFARLIDEAVRVIGSDAEPLDRDSPSLRVVADHIRSCAFLIVDGVLPGNEGRGYVLRRIIRRAARHGHKLGASGTFFHRLVAPLVREMGAAFPELAAAEAHVAEQLRLEEERFAATLAAGLGILDEEIALLGATAGEKGKATGEVTGEATADGSADGSANGSADGTSVDEARGRADAPVIPGEVVFRLYDTYGFPADLTADIARERGLALDMDGFEAAMDEQRARARAASAFGAGARSVQSEAETTFVGYTEEAAEARVLELYVDEAPVRRVEAGQEALVVLDRTPFYAESGGQVGDTGTLAGEGVSVAVRDTRKSRKAWLHVGRVDRGALAVGDPVEARIDIERRRRVRRNHSATHLLHGALREVLGTHVAQRGSLVDGDHLRFDFSHDGPIEEEEKRRIEAWIDEQVRANHPCETIETGMDEAKRMGAMALFGEKYGSRVRVVKLGEESVELCGGTHARATGELGAVRLVSESGVAAGIRRVEAVSGGAALARAQDAENELGEIAALLKAPRGDVLARVRQLQEAHRELGRELEQARARLSSSAGRDLATSAVTLAGVPVLMHLVDEADAKALRALADRLRQELAGGVIVLGGAKGGKASLLATVDPALHDRVTAGELLGQVAASLGGRGGGRADLAQGGAPSLDGAEAAFETARAWLVDRLGAEVGA